MIRQVSTIALGTLRPGSLASSVRVDMPSNSIYVSTAMDVPRSSVPGENVER